MPLIFLDVELPRWLANTADLLGGMTIPLMLLTLGVSLASIRPQHIGSGLVLGGLRIVLGAAVGWAVGTALGLQSLERAVLVVQSSMPVAVFNYLLAVRANREPEQVANPGDVLDAVVVRMVAGRAGLVVVRAGALPALAGISCKACC
jgi:predicted permease